MNEDEKYLLKILEPVFRPASAYILNRVLWNKGYVLDKTVLEALQAMLIKGLIQEIRKEESVGYLIADKDKEFLSIEER